MHRAQRVLGQRAAAGVGQPGDAKVGHLHAAVPQHHHIVRLDVSVDNAPAVGVTQRLDDLGDEVQRLAPVELVPLFIHVLLQGDAVDEFHDDIVVLVRAADIVHSDNVGVRQHGDRLRLGIEAPAQIFIVGQIVPQNFHRHKAIESVAAGLVDLGHTAHTDQLNDLIAVVQQFSDVLIHVFHLPQHWIRATDTLSGAPRLMAMSSSRRQQVSACSPCITS